MIKIGMIGGGYMGKVHANCYRSLKDVRVVGVSDIRPEKAREIADLTGARIFEKAEELINHPEVDTISILLPTYLHKELVIKSAQAKKHLFCEKPFALSVKEVEEMTEEIEKAKVKFMIGMVLRFWPEYVEFKRIVDSQVYGRLANLTCTRLASRPLFGWDKWYFDPKRSGGAALDLHIHDTDYIYDLLGKPNSVYSVGRKADRSWDHIYTIYKYDHTVVHAEGGWVEASFGFVQSIRGVFEDGTVLEYNSKNQPLIVYGKERAELVKVTRPEVDSVDAGGNISALDAYYNEDKYWIECLQNNQYPERVTSQDVKASLEIVFREIEAAERGKEILL